MSDTINRIDININVKVRYIMEILDNAVTSQLVRDACTLDGTMGIRESAVPTLMIIAEVSLNL